MGSGGPLFCFSLVPRPMQTPPCPLPPLEPTASPVVTGSISLLVTCGPAHLTIDEMKSVSTGTHGAFPLGTLTQRMYAHPLRLM